MNAEYVYNYRLNDFFFKSMFSIEFFFSFYAIFYLLYSIKVFKKIASPTESVEIRRVSSPFLANFLGYSVGRTAYRLITEIGRIEQIKLANVIALSKSAFLTYIFTCKNGRDLQFSSGIISHFKCNPTGIFSFKYFMGFFLIIYGVNNLFGCVWTFSISVSCPSFNKK